MSIPPSCFTSKSGNEENTDGANETHPDNCPIKPIQMSVIKDNNIYSNRQRKEGAPLVAIIYKHSPMTVGKMFKAGLAQLGINYVSVGGFVGSRVGWPIERTYEKNLDVPDIVVEVKKFYKASYIVQKIKEYCGIIPSLILQIDGDTHVCNDLGTNDIIFVSIATDPHMPSETYTHAVCCSTYFYSMQTSYMHLFDSRTRYIPYGYDPEVHFIESHNKIYDVCCIGFQFQARQEFGKKLEEAGLKVRFENGPVFDEYRQIVNQSWICFNLSAKDDLNMRVFETLACGTFLVSNITTDMGRFFINGVHYVAYTDLDDAQNKIMYYLENKELLKKIADTGHEAVRPYTYANRLKGLLAEIGFDYDRFIEQDISEATNLSSKARIIERLYRTARQLIDQLRFEDASLVLRFLLAREPSHGRAHHYLALLDFEAGLEDEALRHFVLAEQYAPNNPDNMKNLANLYFLKGESSSALLIFERLSALLPDDTESKMAVAKLNNHLGKKDEAIRSFRELLAMDPGNSEARASLHILERGVSTSLPKKSSSRRKVVIESTHNDYCGGGKYTLQLAFAFSRHCDVFLANFNANDPLLCGIEFPISPYHGDFIADLFLAVSHGGYISPKGRLNGHVCHFPRTSARANALRYDFAISNSAFTDRHQKVVWGLPSFIINPYVPMDIYHIGSKEELIVNVGNFFREPDGHSKNQDLVLDWFIENRLYERYRLVFTGFIDHQSYYEALLDKAAPYPNIEIMTAIPFEQLRDLYSRARFLIHANGYMRNSPEQTEHFGYIAVEAMASGCQPIVHNSGGCSEIEGVRVWDSFADLLTLMGPTEPEKLREAARRYSYEYVSETQVPAFLKAVFK